MKVKDSRMAPGGARAQKAHLIGPDTDRENATVSAKAKDPLDRV
jgi:hypothetical protein